jgi:hypothetical protein
MKLHRRQLIAGAGAAALLGATQRLRAQPSPTPAPAAQAAQPSTSERIAAAALQNRHRLTYSGGGFSGAAWDMLLKEGRAAHFFLVGEEHGIAENPKLAAALFQALAPAGYARLGIEISPQMAMEMDRVLRRGGMAALRRHLADPANAVAFFGMREEAELLAAARAAVPGNRPVLWGLDYEVGADRRLIAMLKAAPKPPAAQRALAALEAASTASWAEYAKTRGPQHIFSFGGDPALVEAVRSAWPRPDASSEWALVTLEETLRINRQFVGGDNHGSNVRRAQLLRSNFLRHWREVRGTSAPRVMMKLGASHMIRGLSLTDTYDLGSLIPEVAAAEGKSSFSMLVVPGAGSQIAGFDPTKFAYQSAPAGAFLPGVEPLTAAAWPDSYTLVDLRPLRRLARGFGRGAAEPNLSRLIHGFDTMLIMSGSTPSANL